MDQVQKLRDSVKIVCGPRLVPDGGAAEMAVSRGLRDRSEAVQGGDLPLCTLCT